MLKNYIAIFSTTNHKGETAIVAQLQYTAKNDCVTQKLNQYIIFYCSLQLNNISYFLSFSSCFLFLLVGFLSLQFSLTLSPFPFFSLSSSLSPTQAPTPALCRPKPLPSASVGCYISRHGILNMAMLVVGFVGRYGHGDGGCGWQWMLVVVEFWVLVVVGC